MNLKEQKYVCVLAECGNITKASEKLYISQPALSIYINNLEKYLGVKLFERVGRKFILTYAGERYVEKARRMLELKKEFDKELSEITDNRSGRIRIGVQLRRAPWLIPPVLAGYRKLYPDVEVVIREGTFYELEGMLDSFELDLLLVNTEARRGDMEYQVIYKEQTLIAVPEIHPLNEKARYVPESKYRELDIKYLSGYDLIIQHPNQSIRSDVDKLLSLHHVTPKRIQVIRNLETAMQMVAEGLGIGFNRAGYAATMKYSKKVNYYTVGESSQTIDFVIGYRKGLYLTPWMEAMIELLKERGRQLC